MNIATGREKREEKRKEKNQSNTRAGEGDYNLNSTSFIEKSEYCEVRVNGG